MDVWSCRADPIDVADLGVDDRKKNARTLDRGDCACDANSK